jgi:hypothetical protein
MNFSRLRIYVGVSIIVLASILQTKIIIDLIIVPTFAHRSMWNNTIYDTKVEELKELLPKRGFIAYINGHPHVDNDLRPTLILFSLLPLIVRPPENLDTWLVVDSPPNNKQEIIRIINVKYLLIKDFNNGLLLYKKEE